VSRLWPEHLRAAVFPDGAWLCRRNGQEVGRFDGRLDGAGDLAMVLEALLAQRHPGRARIELMVSDRLARIVHLPWQDGLANEAQRTAYGRACLERTGLDLRGDWVLQAAFRHFARSGIAYALPRSLVQGARDVLAAHGVQLASILPLSGAAYWRYRSGLGRQRSIIVLEEPGRVSALLIEAGKYVGIQVQPAGVQPEDAVRRLLHAVDALFPGVQRVLYWSASQASASEGVLREALPEAAVEVLDMMWWF